MTNPDLHAETLHAESLRTEALRLAVKTQELAVSFVKELVSSGHELKGTFDSDTIVSDAEKYLKFLQGETS